MSGTGLGHGRIADRPIWSQVVPVQPTGRAVRWVWQVWWGEVLVERGVCRWRWRALWGAWRAHRRVVRFVVSGQGWRLGG